MASAMPWFKLYTEARNDAKLRVLTDDVHRVWFNLLCYAAEQDERGVIEVDDMFILAVEVANRDEELLEHAISELHALRIISFEDDTITFLKFAERQHENPSDAPESTRERKRRQREKERLARENEEGHDFNKGCHDNVTSVSRHVTTCHDTDKDIDKEKEVDNTRAVASTGNIQQVPAEEAPASPPARAFASNSDRARVEKHSRLLRVYDWSVYKKYLSRPFVPVSAQQAMVTATEETLERLEKAAGDAGWNWFALLTDRLLRDIVRYTEASAPIKFVQQRAQFITDDLASGKIARSEAGSTQDYTDAIIESQRAIERHHQQIEQRNREIAANAKPANPEFVAMLEAARQQHKGASA